MVGMAGSMVSVPDASTTRTCCRVDPKPGYGRVFTVTHSLPAEPRQSRGSQRRQLDRPESRSLKLFAARRSLNRHVVQIMDRCSRVG